MASFHSFSRLILLWAGVVIFLFSLEGCGPSQSRDAGKIETACAEIFQKQGGVKNSLHQSISSEEWPAAIQARHPAAVEIFDGDVWVYLTRSVGKVTKGFVYAPRGTSQEGTAVIEYQRTRAAHLYYFVWQP